MGSPVLVHPQTGYVDLADIFRNNGCTREQCVLWLQRPTVKLFVDDMRNLGVLTAIEADANTLWGHPVLAAKAILHCIPPSHELRFLARTLKPRTCVEAATQTLASGPAGPPPSVQVKEVSYREMGTQTFPVPEPPPASPPPPPGLDPILERKLDSILDYVQAIGDLLVYR